jgi:hypothetical protein
LIGGDVPDYGKEYADPWIYNDVIVTHVDGAIEILTYPPEVFPHGRWPVGAVMGSSLYMFGIMDRKHYPHRPRRLTVLRLDTSSYQIADFPVAAPPVWLNLYKGCDVRIGNRIVLPIVRERAADPDLRIAFDLETFVWGKPFPAGDEAT